MNIIIDGSYITSSLLPFKDGRRLYLPLDTIFPAIGWTYSREANSSLALSYEQLNESRTTYLHDEWNDTLHEIDGHIYIHSKRLSGIIDKEIAFDSQTKTVTITSPTAAELEAEQAYRREMFRKAQEAVEEVVVEVTDSMSGEESQKINFGKYSPPAIFDALYTLDDQLQEEGLSLWDELGFYGGYYCSEYGNTPWDVIVFGWTGGDGVHYGFLTEFGSVTDLNEAPIVMVSPMGGDEAGEVVANNIREFLSILAIDESLLYASFDNEEDYLADLRQDEQSEWAPTEEQKAQRRLVMSRMAAALDLPVIEQPYRYLNQVRTERANKILVSTHDGLGVTNVHPDDVGRQHESLLVDGDLESEELQEYLARATYAGKLALLRDFNAKDFDSEDLENIMVEEMINLGLTDELARKNASAW
ncbi:hypothetical protein FHS18_003377 [Paenibacillus phyllosphaerae]|uniref:Uncharacterized protein n=1 Tax=Paenibacillus phyllosphaerae TaxID=274593 RepID=A0A7W5AZH1_9BACL|nr:hypothetical protein [Paenibacillus phyllosphaerae]MBB3111309.1 hypothetical protein [Paenibacillus phyllosphaerae]